VSRVGSAARTLEAVASRQATPITADFNDIGFSIINGHGSSTLQNVKPYLS
jgi:hypothetical protein